MNEDKIDKKIREMMEQKEEEISAFKKLLQQLEDEAPVEDKGKRQRKRKSK